MTRQACRLSAASILSFPSLIVLGGLQHSCDSLKNTSERVHVQLHIETTPASPNLSRITPPSGQLAGYDSGQNLKCPPSNLSAAGVTVMRDPFFVPAVPALSRAVQPWADWLALTTLPLHIHQVLGAALFYTFIHLVVSPAVSMFFFPKHYPMNSRDKRVNWDSHVVSFVQSTLINVLALWVIRTDEERKAMDWEQRVWGYTGAAGMVQAMVVGYFLWDLITTLVYINVFGLSFLAHASSALMVYSFGFVS